MTPYQFSQAVKIKDKHFKVGINDVSEDIESTSDFLHFVRCGYIKEAPPQVVAAQPVAVDERSKALAERIAKKLEAKKEELKQKPEPGAKELQENPHLNVAKASSPDGKVKGVPGSEPEAKEEDETPQQKAARTRKANLEKAKAEKGE